MGYIYKITNLEDGKLYIGKTTQSINKRFRKHISDAFNENNRAFNYHLQRAIRKYGADSFAIEEVEHCDNRYLSERERYWIKFYNSFESGYNMTHGGDGAIRYDIDEIVKAWQSGLNIKSISGLLGMNEKTVTVHLRDFGVSEDEIQQRRYETMVDKVGVPVYQYDLCENYMAEYPTASSACKKYGSNSILIALRGKNRSACGFMWKYFKANKIEPHFNSCTIPVYQYSEDGEYIASFESATSAGKTLGINATGISSACHGRTRGCGGYRWSHEKVDRLPKLDKKLRRVKL